MSSTTSSSQSGYQEAWQTFLEHYQLLRDIGQGHSTTVSVAIKKISLQKLRSDLQGKPQSAITDSELLRKEIIAVRQSANSDLAQAALGREVRNLEQIIELAKIDERRKYFLLPIGDKFHPFANIRYITDVIWSGVTLRHLLFAADSTNSPLHYWVIYHFWHQFQEIINFLHGSTGMVHNNLSDTSIMVRYDPQKDGDLPCLVLTDFSKAKLLWAEVEHEGRLARHEVVEVYHLLLELMAVGQNCPFVKNKHCHPDDEENRDKLVDHSQTLCEQQEKHPGLWRSFQKALFTEPQFQDLVKEFEDDGKIASTKILGSGKVTEAFNKLFGKAVEVANEEHEGPMFPKQELQDEIAKKG